MSDLVQLATFEHLSEADAVRISLEQEGIECFVEDAGLVGVNWFLNNAVGGIKLKVPAKHAETAMKLLDQIRASRAASEQALGEITFDCEECDQPITVPAKRRGRVEVCPHCHEYVDVPEE